MEAEATEAAETALLLATEASDEIELGSVTPAANPRASEASDVADLLASDARDAADLDAAEA